MLSQAIRCGRYYAVIAVVASSRVYVKIHHPSDVVAGALLGVALSRLVRRAWPMPARPECPGGDPGSHCR